MLVFADEESAIKGLKSINEYVDNDGNKVFPIISENGFESKQWLGEDSIKALTDGRYYFSGIPHWLTEAFGVCTDCVSSWYDLMEAEDIDLSDLTEFIIVDETDV